MSRSIRIAIFALIVSAMSCVSLHASSREGYAFSDYFRMPSSELLVKGGNYLMVEEKPDSALMCFSIVAERYTPSLPVDEQRACAMAYNNCGFIYYYFYYDFPEAFNALLLAKNLCTQFDDRALEANIYLNLGNCYAMCFQLGLSVDVSDKALECYSAGYDIAREISNWPILLNCFSNLSMAPFVVDCPKYVVDQILSFPDVPIPTDTPLYELYQLNYKTAKSELEHNFPQAVAYLQQQLEFYREISTYNTNRREIKADILYGLSYCSQYAGDIAAATSYAVQLIEFAQDNNRPYFEALGYKRLISLYVTTGDYEKEKTARLRFYEIKDSLMSHHNLMMVDNLEFIAKLRQDNRDYIYREQIYQKRVMILCGVIVLLIVTLPLLVILYSQNRKLKASYLALYERQQQLIRQADADKLARTETEANAVVAEKVRSEVRTTPEVDEVKARILNVLDNDDAIFNVDFSLDKLAELTKIKSRQLSSILNEVFDKNFYALLNEYRIREACRRLVDKERYGHLTIEAISQSVGYKSRTSLVTAFKKETGLTPSEYQKIALSQSNN